MPVQPDPIQVKFEGQGHMSNLPVSGWKMHVTRRGELTVAESRPKSESETVSK